MSATPPPPTPPPPNAGDSSTAPVVELTDPQGTRSFVVDGLLDIGRAGPGVEVRDATVSSRHLRLEPVGGGIVVTDVGSANGTFVDGQRITAPVRVGPGATVAFGSSTLRVLAPAGRHHAAPAASTAPPPPSAPTAGATGGAGVLRTDAVELRFVPGTQAGEMARSYAAAAGKARRALRGFGSESWAAVPVVHLVDPYLDGDGQVTTEPVVDVASQQAWIVVSADRAVEPPHRVLALLFGAAFPAAARLQVLLEGYGLHLADVDDPTADLAARQLPRLDEAGPDDRSPMAVSFVRFLLQKEGPDGLLRVLGAAPERLDETVRDTYGASLGQLERSWRTSLVTGSAQVRAGEFVRLSMRYLRPYRWRQAEIFVYMLASLAFTAAFPFVTRRLFDTALPSGEMGQVIGLLVVLGAAFVVSLLAGVRQAYQTAWVSTAVTRDLRQSLFDRLQVLPTSWFGTRSQGDVLSRLFSDVGAVQNGLSQAIGQGVYQMLSLVVTAVIMLSIHVGLGIVVLLAAPVVGLVYRSMASGAQRRSLAVQEAQSGLLGIAAENHRATPVVRMFGLADRERRRFAGQSDRVFRATRRLSMWGGLFGLSVNLVVTLLRLAVLGVGAWLIIEGRFSTGGLVAFLSIMGEVLAPVTVLVSLGQDVQSSMGSLVRIDEVLTADTEPDDLLPPVAPFTKQLRLVDLGMSYTPDRRALADVNVTITAGTRTAFVGPSGSGKSTVMRLLMRLNQPDEGAIVVDGTDLAGTSPRSWRDQLGVVFQDSFLFDVTLRENIALGNPGATDDDIRDAARAAGVEDFVGSLDRGWETLVGEGGGNLSGGQRQRVAIARALVRRPRLLLLDEATSALDPATERQINETIERVGAGRTVVAITHRLASVQDYDQIVVVDDGRVVEVGRHAELLARRGLYARLWAEQTGSPLPPLPPFDPAPAIRRLPMFHGADDALVARVVEAATRLVLEAGRRIADGDGVLLVASGRGEVTSPGAAAVGVRPGDAVGVAAAMGAPAVSSLVASEPMDLLHLSGQALRRLATVSPTTPRAGGGTQFVPPRSATRLGRATAVRSAPVAAGVAALPPPSPFAPPVVQVRGDRP
jgi:ATP-binding cassette subfamily B protein